MPIKKIASALLLTLSLSGCSSLYDTFVYQIDVTQGNYIDNEKIARIELGMSQEQIIFILGSPMLIDQFDSSKWYYIRFIKPGGEKIQQEQVVLTFANKHLVEISEHHVIGENPLTLRNEPNAATESSAEDNQTKPSNSTPVLN